MNFMFSISTKLLFALVCVSLLTIPCKIFAASYYDSGTALNPINVNLDLSSFLVAQKEATLKVKYGSTREWSTCLDKSGYLTRSDHDNPAVKESYVNYMEYCLESLELQKKTANTLANLSDNREENCKEHYGNGAYYDVQTTNNTTDGSIICDCRDGFMWNGARTTCIAEPNCSSSETISISGISCISKDQVCKNYFGAYSFWTGRNNSEGNFTCSCGVGSEWNGSVCIEKATDSSNIQSTVVQTESAKKNISITKPDPVLTKRLSGSILLQIESHGEAWYVDPITEKRYYMKDGPTAYEMMRSFGLGVTESDYAKITNGGILTKSKLKGRIILRVQEHGEAYWIDSKDLSVRYLQNGDEAYRVMRLYSLGITNVDLEKVLEGSIITKK